jgi:4-amino-4-deoxy-L-arabinose transferase-like glycosyltransferase
MPSQAVLLADIEVDPKCPVVRDSNHGHFGPTATPRRPRVHPSRARAAISSRHGAAVDVLVIASLWGLGALIVAPIGDFPLNDDWSYALATRDFLARGDFRPAGWVAMPLITNVLWGALFCVPFGFSFTALRVSTLVLSLLGPLGIYAFLRELSHPRGLALTAALTVAFNPLYYALSHTFMTDVPFAVMATLASLFLARGIRHDSTPNLLIGTLLAIGATLSRQLGLAIGFAFAPSLLLARGLSRKHLLQAAIPPVCCIASLLIFQAWLHVTGRLPALYHQKTAALFGTLSNPAALLVSFATNAHIALLYLGLFLLPTLILVGAAAMRARRRSAPRTVVALLACAVAVLAVGSVLVIRSGKSMLMPLAGNVLIPSGIGPLTLRDTYILNTGHVPPLPSSLWLAVTTVSLVGAVLFALLLGLGAVNISTTVWRGARLSADGIVGVFLALSAMIYLLPLLGGGFFDRYLIPAVPLLTVGIAVISVHPADGPPSRTSPPAFVGLTLLAAFLVFSIGTTRDYLAWNRARWQALNDLVADGRVNAADIDGGFEFNGLHFYDPDYKRVPGKSWWWVQGDGYQIGFGRVPGYEVVREYTYPVWIPPRSGTLVVMRKAQ